MQQCVNAKCGTHVAPMRAVPSTGGGFVWNPPLEGASRTRIPAIHNRVPGTHLRNCLEAPFQLLCNYVPGTESRQIR